MAKTGLYFFRNDFRLHDNPGLLALSQRVDKLICVAHTHPDYSVIKNRFPQYFETGQARRAFHEESLACLSLTLSELGQQLVVIDGEAVSTLRTLADKYQVAAIAYSACPGYDEQIVIKELKHQLPDVSFSEYQTATLFSKEDLPFGLADLPKTFSQFRRAIGNTVPRSPASATSTLPPPPAGISGIDLPINAKRHPSPFRGGELIALDHLKQYFSASSPRSYKLTRNELEGWERSTKLSPWLANGCLSVRLVYEQLRAYESVWGANESTEWIYFELLWREYFHFYAQCHGSRLFQFSGTSGRAPKTSFYPEAFMAWQRGNTPWPLVNACMQELASTGYMSNRGRQIAASCLINELQLDWRMGAAYFQSQLIDYDVGSNWGNWQYIAGVGADPRGGRHFNIDKQTQQYDPFGEYSKKWGGFERRQALYQQDYNGWPIEHSQ